MSPRPPAPPARTMTEQDAAHARTVNLVKFVSVAVVLVMALAVVLVVFLSKNNADGNTTYENAGITVGHTNTNVPHVVVYEDFQCPWCALFHRQAGSGLDDLTDTGQATVTYVIRTFLDDGGNTSTLASHAALCARDQDLFEPFHKHLFASHPVHTGGMGHQTGWTVDDLTDVAVTAGLPEDKTGTFQQCVLRERHADEVTAMEGRAKLDGFTGTPTVTVNGQPLPDETMQALLDGTTTIELVLQDLPANPDQAS